MAAKRYGGKYSPDGASPDTAPSKQNPFRTREVAPTRPGAKTLFFLAIPLIIAGFLDLLGSNASAMVLEFAGGGALLGGAWLLREGFKAEDAYNSRTIARPPAFPRKACAAVLAAIGVTLGFYAGGQGLASLVFGLLAGAAHVAAFGVDPMGKKGLEGVSEFDTERVARAVDKAEGLVSELTTAAERLNDRGLQARIERLTSSARAMFRTVEEDPRDLQRARKFMTVYLKGARDATRKYVDLARTNPNQAAKTEFEALLNDLEASFDAQRETLLADDRTDLDIEIETLRERLKHEGIAAS